MITTLPGGNTVRSDYSGSTVTLTDQVNRKIKRESDGLGRLIKVREQTSAGALTQATNYTYSLLDKLTLVNQGNQTRAYKYDAIGRLLYEKIPEQAATINDGTGTMWSCAYAYTEYGAVKKKTDARGVEGHYAYDALHQVTQIWYTGIGGDDSGSVRPALPSGVAATGEVGFGYTSWGNLSSIGIFNTSGVGHAYTESYTFDEFARPESVTKWILGQVSDGRKTYTTSYEYNGGSQLSKMIYPSGQQVAVNHDDKGRTQSLTYNPGDTSGYLTGMTYNISGQVTGLTLGNGVVEGYGYDANRLQLMTQTATKGANSRMNLTYSYQALAGQMGAGSTAGNAGQLMSIGGTINNTTESASYTYDLVGRLTESEQTSNGVSASRYFVYDRWGNRTQVQLDKQSAPIQTITLEQSGGIPTNRITSVTSGSTLNYTYDAAGNVTNDGAHAYTYDAENRVVSVDGGATAQYRYDHQNRRVTKIVGSSWTHYIWEGSQVIGEQDATTAYSTNPTYQVKSARVDYIYAGGRMINSRQRTSSTGPWTTQYYLSDRLSVRMTLDTSGNVLGRQGHLPFGEDFGASGTQEKHHLTSYERDNETGTDYAINRQYAQGVGRFMQADAYKASGGIIAPQSWNRYSYVQNMPVDAVDPLGLFLGHVWGAGDCNWGIFSFCAPFISPIPTPSSADPPPDPPPTPTWWTGFSAGQLEIIDSSIMGALNLLQGSGCEAGLREAGIDFDDLSRVLVGISAKPEASDPTGTEHGGWRIFNGDTSTLPLSRVNRARRDRPGVVIYGVLPFQGLKQGDVFLYSLFFDASGGARIGIEVSRAILFIHEAVHLTGMRDTDFGRNQDQGSHNLSNIIIRSCFQASYSFRDLAFPVP